MADLVTPPRRKPREMTTWSVDECRLFLGVAPESAHGPIWLTALATGLRKGELLGLRWRDVQWERETIAVRQTVGKLAGRPDIKPAKTKSSRREVSVSDGILTSLKEHKSRQNATRLQAGPYWQGCDLLFCTGLGTPIHPDNADRDFHRLIKRASVPSIRIHDLRHSYATLALQQGLHVKALSESTDHADIGTTLRTYTHVIPAQRREIATKMDDLLFGRS